MFDIKKANITIIHNMENLQHHIDFYSDPAGEDADGGGEGAGDDQGLHQLHCGELLWRQSLARSYGNLKNSCAGKTIDNTL